MNSNVDSKEILWSNQFVKQIGNALKAHDISGSDKYHLDIRTLQA